MLRQEESPGIHFILLTAYGITKEPVASNRIYGLLSGLSGTVQRLTLIGVEYPGQTGYDFSSFGEKLKIVSLKPVCLPGPARKAVSGLKRRSGSNSDGVKSSGLQKERSPSPAKRIYRTLMFVFSAEGHFVPLRKMFFSALREIRRSVSSGYRTVVFSTTGPPSAVLISSILKRIFGRKIFLINDFRDVIFENPYIKDEAIPFVLEKIERFSVKSADAVTSVSRSCIESLVEKPERSFVLYNGYTNLSASISDSGETVPRSIGYFGAVYSARIASLKNLAEAIGETGFTFYYAGRHGSQVESVFRSAGADRFLRNLGALSKEEALKWQGKMQVLLVLKTDGDRGVIPGKYYECIVTKKPVLVIGSSDDEFNEIANRVGGTFVVESNPEKVKEALLLLKDVKEVERNELEVRRFDWKNLAREFFDELVAPCLRYQDRTLE